MDIITLSIIKHLDFNQMMAGLLEPNDSDRIFVHQVSAKTIILVALTTGLPLRRIIKLNWDAILEYDHKGGSACKGSFELERHYVFPISKKIYQQLVNFYLLMKQPDFSTPIAKKIKDYKKFSNWYTVTNISLGMRKVEELGMDTISNFKNEHMTQILFGRRVFEVCGYSNETSNLLKGLFKINTNKKLFNFLGYESKDQIKYELSNISIIEGLKNRFKHGSPRSFLVDSKHFYNQIDKSNMYYPFQHFQLFYDFLQNLRISVYDTKTQGVLVLLMLSLSNGIRPSSLLKLRWSDMFEIGKKNGNLDCYLLKKSFKIDKHRIILDHNTKKQVLLQFKLLHAGVGVKIDTDNYQLTFITKAPSLNYHCFVTNRLNALTQPSLIREIKNALRIAGFQHAEKFTTKSTMIMYGRRIIEVKGNHPPTIRALKRHFNIRRTQDLFDFLYISNKKDINIPDIGEFSSIFEHVLYDI